MGQFVSYCKGCSAPITWFLEAKDHCCSQCGTLNTKVDVERSWQQACDIHNQLLALSSKPKSEVKTQFQDDPVALAILSRMSWNS